MSGYCEVPVPPKGEGLLPPTAAEEEGAGVEAPPKPPKLPKPEEELGVRGVCSVCCNQSGYCRVFDGTHNPLPKNGVLLAPNAGAKVPPNREEPVDEPKGEEPGKTNQVAC